MAQNRPPLSQADKDALDAAGREWKEAAAAGDKATAEAAHQRAEAIRNKNGYSGGADGSQYIPTQGQKRPYAAHQGQPTAPTTPAPQQAPSYVQHKPPKYTPAGQWSAGNAPVDMLAPDKEALAGYGQQWSQGSKEYQAAKTRGDQAAMAAAQQKMDFAHAEAERLRGKYKFSGGMDGSEYIPLEEKEQFEMPNLTGLLDKWLALAQQQQQQAADYAVKQGVANLERAEADAQAKFNAQMNQTARDERKALDNQALYMEARGDRGGIGQAQYNQIQAQAMQNRQAINAARTKLATDTARQIADLRAQGEFKKADALLQLGQQYLAQMMDLQKWGAEYKLNVDQFNSQLDHWNKEFEAQIGGMMGNYHGAPTLEAQKLEQDRLIELGMAALNMGIRPSPAQIQAMGYTDAQINTMLNEYKLKQQMANRRPSSGGGGGHSGGSGSKKPPHSPQGGDIYDSLFKQGVTPERAYAVLIDMGYAQGAAEKISEQYEELYVDLGHNAMEGTPQGDWANNVVNGTFGYGANFKVRVPFVGDLTIAELFEAVQNGDIDEMTDEEGNIGYAASANFLKKKRKK